MSTDPCKISLDLFVPGTAWTTVGLLLASRWRGVERYADKEVGDMDWINPNERLLTVAFFPAGTVKTLSGNVTIVFWRGTLWAIDDRYTVGPDEEIVR